MWRRCIAAGIATEMLVAEKENQQFEEGLFVSAIVHQLGRVALASLYPDQYNTMIGVCQRDQKSLRECERLVFSESHAEVMCQLLVSWNVPAELCQPLRHILDDDSQIAQLTEPLRTRVQLVKLAIVLRQIAVGKWRDWDWLELPSEAV